MHKTLLNQLSIRHLLENKEWCSQFNDQQLNTIRNLSKTVADHIVIAIAQPNVNAACMNTIAKSITNHLDIVNYITINHTPYHCLIIRKAMDEGCHPSKIANLSFNNLQLTVLKDALFRHYDISDMLDPNITHLEMIKLFKEKKNGK